MEFTEFMEGYNQFCENWQRKGSTKNAEFLFSKLNYIPSLAWREMVEEMLVNLDRFPRIKDIHANWHSWRRSHSSELIQDAPPESDCPMCSSTGLLQFTFKEHNLTYTASQPCGYCENWKRHISPKRWSSIKKFKVSELRDNGWDWVEPPPKCTREEFSAAMDKFFDRLGRKPKDAYKPDPDYLKRQDNYEEDTPF